MFTKSIAVEYGKHNIRANCICPGLVETPMTQGFVADKKVATEILKAYPAGLKILPMDACTLHLTSLHGLRGLHLP